MILEIPDHWLQQAGLGASDVMLQVALMLYQEEKKITLGQASQLAGMHQVQFQKELAQRKIPMHYGVAEFEADLETLSKVKPK